MLIFIDVNNNIYIENDTYINGKFISVNINSKNIIKIDVHIDSIDMVNTQHFCFPATRTTSRAPSSSDSYLRTADTINSILIISCLPGSRLFCRRIYLIYLIHMLRFRRIIDLTADCFLIFYIFRSEVARSKSVPAYQWYYCASCYGIALETRYLPGFR